MKRLVILLAILLGTSPAYALNPLRFDTNGVLLAETHVITTLGSAPLFRPINSTAQLEADIKTPRFLAALKALGIAPQGAGRIVDFPPMTYGILPRHLDEMAFLVDGKIRVLSDVLIPAGTKGWTIPFGAETLYVPQACGNVSFARAKAIPLTLRPPVQRVLSEATGVMSETPAETPTPSPSPSATPGPPAWILTPAAPEAPHSRFPWWIALLLLPFAFHDSHHSVTVGTAPHMPSPTPQPTVTCAPK